MKKQELKKYLKIYSKIRKDILANNSYSIITFYNRKRKITLPFWLKNVDDSLNEIANSFDPIIKEIIEKSYFVGIPDVKLVLELPVSLATLYRIKNKIEEVLFTLLIFDGVVERNDILNNL